MKDLLKKIIPPFVRGFIRKIFPSAIQKEVWKTEKMEIAKRTAFYRSFIREGDLVFDVGANFGNRISPMLSIGARVVAVEPLAICHDFLKKKFGTKITLVTKALGSAEGTQTFFISTGPQMSSFSTDWINSVKESGRFKDYSWENGIPVKMTTLDRLISEFGMPDFVKIDVEGYEFEVLQGLTQPFKMISLEYTVPEQSHKVIACIERLDGLQPTIECNYSIGESMEFSLEHWLSSDKMKEFVLSDEFINTGFGDIYVRQATT